MSKHTVSLNGIDTGKVGNNKIVKLSKEFPDPSKINTVGEYAKYFDITPEAALSQLGGGVGLTPVLPTGMDAEIDSKTGRLVGKDRPTQLIPSVTAKVTDFLTGGLTDFDREGGGLFGRAVENKTTGLGSKPTDFYLSKTIKDQLKEDAEIEKKGPYADMDELVKANLEYAEGMIPLQRKLARQQAIDAQLQYMATEPIRQIFLNRAAEDAQNRFIRGKFQLEAMPSNIQNIMTAKQAQRSLASSAFAEEARAAAAQQDAATRFAGLGMQRRFG